MRYYNYLDNLLEVNPYGYDNELAEMYIDMIKFDYFYHAINELGEKSGPITKLSVNTKSEIKLKFDIEGPSYIFVGRITNDLLQVLFHPENDNSLKILNNISRKQMFILIGSLVQCVFDCFRYNKDIKRVLFISNNKKMEQLHNTMVTWIPKKYKEIKFLKKENVGKPHYWFEKINLTKEHFLYTQGI